MECDTIKTPINTTAVNLSLAESADPNILMTININEAQKNEDTPIVTPYTNRNVYFRNSSGLSGGAIAGIVIVCVVTLLAVSLFAIMLKRPKKDSNDNPTEIRLKSFDN